MQTSNKDVINPQATFMSITCCISMRQKVLCELV